MLGILLCIGSPIAPLGDIAKQGAAALELVNDYTDVIEIARRRKPTTAAAEIQQNLFPPRITHIAGAQLAGEPSPRPMRSAATGSTSSRIATARGWQSRTQPAPAPRPPASVLQRSAGSKP